ncbi:L,D-transpeptidase family protein [Pseudochrobactrum saccharolyticum]|uniref:L,D-transpeptidase family protein n=1 Tax=Pseudochrobactrum saccharolyticum TaxID=354352 RepID=UPI0027960F8F|nr:L,D-transpeptidase family protein [Pseudochrobactrum saccharolyticum]
MTLSLKSFPLIVSSSMRNAFFTTAITAVTGISVLAPVQSANAASNLMDLFREKREAREMQHQQMQQPVQQVPQAAGAARTAKPAGAAQPAKSVTAPVKAVSVKGPQIYDYKPEKLVKVDFTAVDMQLTAAISEDEGGLLPSALYAEAADFISTLPQRADGLINPVAKKTAVQTGAALVTAVLDAMKATDVKAEQSVAEAIVSFYATEQALLWSDGLNVSSRAEDVLALFERAEEDGLVPAEYAVKVPDLAFDAAQKDQRIREMAAFEINLTARALRYALDAGEGRVIANRLSGFHDLPRNRIKPELVLKALVADAEPAETLAAFNPQNSYYQKLKAQLASMKPETKNTVRIAADTLIKPGQDNAELPKILALIVQKAPAGYLNSYQEMFDRHKNGTLYDPELVAAVKDYQKLMGKTPDGVIGRATIAGLQGETSSVKRERILYAMERLRWLPRDFGQRYVFVNQPAYRAQYFDQGKEQLAMDVVIGSPRNQTHFFYDTISTVVFNPSWGVPRSIVMNEMMPRILADSGYLDRNNYEVIAGGKRVASSSVNWSAVAQGKAHVGVRQKPGPNNALGELKILFPNSHDIYLHDTPSKAAFKRDMRAISHGCIRLADPRAMASAVMSTGEENLTKYFGKNERGIKVPSGVPIYLTYFTAWPDEASGKIRYYDDVYARDEGLAKAFQKTEQSRVAAM